MAMEETMCSHIVAPSLKELFYFRIYNRWGQSVFETKDLLKGWDGRINGQLPETGVYVWSNERG